MPRKAFPRRGKEGGPRGLFSRTAPICKHRDGMHGKPTRYNQHTQCFKFCFARWCTQAGALMHVGRPWGRVAVRRGRQNQVQPRGDCRQAARQEARSLELSRMMHLTARENSLRACAHLPWAPSAPRRTVSNDSSDRPPPKSKPQRQNKWNRIEALLFLLLPENSGHLYFPGFSGDNTV